MRKIFFIHTILITFVSLSIFMFGAGVENASAVWGTDTMGSYAIGTRDVLTQWNPADQAMAKFILEKRPDIKAAMLRRDPNNNEPNMVNDWAFGGGSGTWHARELGRYYAAEIKGEINGGPGTLLAWAKQLGWQDTSPITTFTDGTTRTQAEMGAELWRAGWEGDAPPEASFGSSIGAILPAYLRTTGKKVAGSTTVTGTITASPNPVPVGSGVGATTITWSGVTASGQVRVYENNGNVVCSPTKQCLFAQGASGSQAFTTVETNHTYIFKLYNGACTKDDCSDQSPAAGTVTVTRGGGTVTGTITASPNPVPAGGGKTTITWTTSDNSAANVRVFEPGSPASAPCTNAKKCDFAFATPGSQDAPWITPGHTYQFNLYKSQCIKDDCSDQGTPLGTVTVTATTASPSPSPSPSGSTGTVTTSFYKVAGNPADLDNDTTTPWKVYTSDTVGKMDIAFEFTDTIPGQKFVWVQFKFSDGTKSQKISKQINYVGPDPIIDKQVDCSLDTSGAINFKIKGANFGKSKGNSKLTANTSNITVDDWKETEINGKLASTTVTGTQKFDITLTREDGAPPVTQACTLGVTQISLGAKLFCQVPNKGSANNVKISIVEDSATGSAKPVLETVTIDTNGLIQGLKTKVQEGKKYKLSIKVPGGLRKQVEFTASSGTTVIPNVSLPVGDIFPAGTGDGIINAPDKAELNRQWILGASATGRGGDFNGDGKVNSIDWACMRENFGKSDAPDLQTTVI